MNSFNESEFIQKMKKKETTTKQRNFSPNHDDIELDYDEEYDDDMLTTTVNNDIDMITNADAEIGFKNEYNQQQETMHVDDKTANNSKLLIRCSYWPLCNKKEGECLYLHPNKPCTLFPACSFGKLCHYIHPTCRYDGFCTRPDCLFTHYNINKKPGFVAVPETSEPMKVLSSIDNNNGMKIESSSVAPSNISNNSSSLAPNITINKLQPYNFVNPNLAINNNNNSSDNSNDSSKNSDNSANTISISHQIDNTINKISSKSGYNKPRMPYAFNSNQFALNNRSSTVSHFL
jgi:hypothetical protein